MNSICVNVFCYENDLVYPVHIPDKKFEDCNKTENKNKNTFADIVYSVLRN